MAQVVWITQDNYSQWRYSIRDGSTDIRGASNPYPTRDECAQAAALAYPGVPIHGDGLTMGRDEPVVPLPRVDPELEAAAGGFVIPE